MAWRADADGEGKARGDGHRDPERAQTRESRGEPAHAGRLVGLPHSRWANEGAPNDLSGAPLSASERGVGGRGLASRGGEP